MTVTITVTSSAVKLKFDKKALRLDLKDEYDELCLTQKMGGGELIGSLPMLVSTQC